MSGTGTFATAGHRARRRQWRHPADHRDSRRRLATDYDIVFADTDTLTDIVTDINALAGLSAAVTASIDTSGGTNKLRSIADSADIDFQIGAASTDALTTRLGLTEATPHTSSNLLAQGASRKARH